MDDFDAELAEALMPAKTIAEILPDIAELGASLSRIIPILEEWEDVFEDIDSERAQVIQQAYSLLGEAQTSVHASAAMLHVLMTGVSGPEDLFDDDDEDDE